MYDIEKELKGSQQKMNFTEQRKLCQIKARLSQILKGDCIHKDTMGEGRKLKYVAVAKNAQTEETYILYQIEENRVR